MLSAGAKSVAANYVRQVAGVAAAKAQARFTRSNFEHREGHGQVSGDLYISGEVIMRSTDSPMGPLGV